MPTQGVTQYLGSEPLDPALADRFPFVVPVPDWKQLSKAERRRLVSWKDQVDVMDADPDWHPEVLRELVAETASLIPLVEAEVNEWLTDYIVLVVDLLEKAQLPQSPRRARMLARSVAAIHAARRVLEGDDAELVDSTELALVYGLPQTASEVPPSEATIVAVHKQAWEIASLMDDDRWRVVLEEKDPLQRVLKADELGFNDLDMSRLITQALGAETSEARRAGLGTAMFLTYRLRRNLAATAWEPLAGYASKLMEPRHMQQPLRPGADLNIWNDIKDWLTSFEQGNGPQAILERNFVLAGFPEWWRKENWREALDRFRADLMTFEVQFEEMSK